MRSGAVPDPVGPGTSGVSRPAASAGGASIVAAGVSANGGGSACGGSSGALLVTGAMTGATSGSGRLAGMLAVGSCGPDGAIAEVSGGVSIRVSASGPSVVLAKLSKRRAASGS